MIKNKKGFTLIEILAAITILGILTGIAVVSVTKIIENGKKKHYLTAEENMKLAGQSFAQQNRSNLPKAIGQKTKISMKKLIDKNYIQTIKDYSENDCDMDKSYVQIFKYSQSDYSYVAYLECPNYNSKENISDITPEIDAKIDENEDARTAHARIKITGNDKIVSYSYILYRNDKQIKNTGNVQEKGLPATKNINFSLEEYTPGNIKLVVTATNVYGNTKTVTVTKDIPDRKNPTCVIKTEDQPTSPKTWIKDRNGERKITVGCEDGETGSGCKRKEYSKTFRDSMRTGKITIEDEAGNKTDCEVSVYIDKINPTITVNAFNRDASGKKVGNAVKTVSTTLDSTSKTLDLTSLSSTKWLNNTYYPNGIYYEIKINDNLELYTYKLTGNKTGLTENHSEVNAITRSINNSNVSGTAKTKNTSITTDGYNKTKVEISDEAGNTATVTMITPLDRVAPTKPTVSMYKWSNNSTRPTLNNYSTLSSYQNDTWSNRSIYTIATGSTDGMSGFKEYQHNASGATADTTNNAGQARSVEAEGISYVQFRACDIAGNCSDYTANKTIKIDKTAPTCEVSGGNAAWINASSSTTKRTITATCVDNGSQCDSTRAIISLDYTDDIDVTNAGAAGVGQGGTVYDNAGNSVSCAANQTVKIDKTAPTAPTVSMYKWSNNSTRPTASNHSGLTAYGNDTWSNKNIFTIAGDSTDETSGVAKYQFNASGATADATDSDGRSRSVEAEGISHVQYRACDHAGNCSNYSPEQTIKIDKTSPECTNSGDSTTWTKNDRTISWGCDDGTSGCNSSYSGSSKKFTSTTKNSTIAEYTIKDNAGNTTTCPARTTKVYVDKTAPTCSITGDSKTWTKNNRTITWGCDDSHSGCNSSYSGGSTPFSATTKTSTIAAYTIKDNVGNTTECAATTVDVYVDKTVPTCPITGDSTTWTKNDRTITWGCGDTDSGCKSGKSGSSTKYSSTTKTATIAKYTVEDNAGNSTECSAKTVNVYVDKTSPTCTKDGDSTTWTNGDRTITWGCSDDDSGCDTSYSGSSKTFNTTTKTSKISSYTIKDKAGNSVTCSERTANVYVDKTAPTITSITNPTGGVATQTPFALTLNGTDSGSGISKWRYKYGSTNWVDYSSSNKSPFTTTNFSAVRNEDVYISACDVAGNCSEPSTSKIYIVSNLCDSTTAYNCSGWSWSNCTKDCDTGTKYEYRTCDYKSAYDNSTYCSSGTEYRNQNTACNTHACAEDINSTKYSGCDVYYITTCDSTNCTYTNKNGKSSTGTIAKSSLTDSRNTNCAKSTCPDSSTIFGEGKGTISGNYGARINTSGWGNWCYASGGPCSPSTGYERVCVVDICRGELAKDLKTKWNCDYSRAWCSCK